MKDEDIELLTQWITDAADLNHDGDVKAFNLFHELLGEMKESNRVKDILFEVITDNQLSEVMEALE